MIARVFKVVPDPKDVGQPLTGDVLTVGYRVVRPRDLVPPVPTRRVAGNSSVLELRLVVLGGPKGCSVLGGCWFGFSHIVDGGAFRLVVRSIVCRPIEAQFGLVR